MQTQKISHDDIARIRSLLECYQLAPGGEVAQGLLAEAAKILKTYQAAEPAAAGILAGATINDITEREHWHAESIREGLADAEAGNLVPLDSVKLKHKPAGDDWIEWSGGKCPVEIGTLIDVRYRDGSEITRLQALVNCEGRDASSRFWDNDGMENDIIAYRLHTPEVGQA